MERSVSKENWKEGETVFDTALLNLIIVLKPVFLILLGQSLFI